MFENEDKGNKSIVSLVDDMNEHLGKSLALSAMLTADNVLSINEELIEHYFGHLQNELWQLKVAWQELKTYIPTQAQRQAGEHCGLD